MTTEEKTGPGDPDMLWVHEHMKELREYQGQWIAVFEKRVVAAGSTVDELVEQAEAQGVGEIFVTKIPDDVDREVYFIG